MPVTSLEAGRLRVEFTRQGDRFEHQVLARQGAEPHVCIATSIAGVANSPWPASPPLQSLHVERLIDGRLAALLVGMAGNSHWSASVVADEAAGRLEFDIACRLHSAAEWLGSTYQLRILRGETLNQQLEAAAQLELIPGVALFCDSSTSQFRTQSPAEHHIASEPRSSGQQGMISVTPAQLPQPPATIRWRYHFAAL